MSFEIPSQRDSTTMETHPSHLYRHRRRERVSLIWAIVWILWVGQSQRGGALASANKAIVVAAAASLIPSSHQTINGSDTPHHGEITGNRSPSPQKEQPIEEDEETCPARPPAGATSPTTSGKGTRMTGAGSHSRKNRSIFSKHLRRTTSLSSHPSSNCNPKQRISTQATMKALSGNYNIMPPHNSNHKNKDKAHSTAAAAAAPTTKRLYAKRSADGRQLLLRFHSHDANDSSGGLVKDGIVTLSLSAASSSANKQEASRLDVQMISTKQYNDGNRKEGGKSKKWTKQWVPLEGIYGVYDLPSGPHLVLITDSDVIYQAPPVASDGSDMAPLMELRKIRSMEMVSFPVDDTDAFPRSVAQTKQEQRQLTLLRKSFREHDLYYVPHTEEEHVVQDVTHTLQRSFVHWSQRQQQRQHHQQHNNGPTPQRSPKWWWSLLMITSPNNINLGKGQILPPRPDSRFFWNEEQIQPFLQPMQHQQQSIVNDTWSTNPCALLMDHVIPVTSAFVGVETHISLSQSLAVTYDELLMSRRSKYRAGTRFTRRGADATGAVANYAETEQICLIMTNVTTDAGKQDDCVRLQEVYSHVQTRGSIPLRWSSPADVKTYRPRILIGVDPLAQARALRTHVLEQLAIYGSGRMKSSTSGSTVATKLSLRQKNSKNVDESNEDAKMTMVNLIDKKGDQGRLGRAFDAVLQAVLDVYGEPPTRSMLRSRNKSKQRQSNTEASETENPSSSDSSNVGTFIPRGIVRHVWFDFHAECKNGQWGKLSNLLGDVTTNLDRQGYFAAVPLSDSWNIVKTQDGAVRTNCMDCLDRTNVVQSIFGRYMLYQQLHQRLGLARLQQHENKGSSASSSSSSSLSTKRTLPVEYVVGFRKSSYMSLPWSNGEASHRLLWADNADAISRLYAGTPALKGDFTRTGKRTKRGALDDGMNSLQRYYLNNFMDADRQEGMDLLTGHADFSFVMDDSSTDSAPSPQTNSDTSKDSTGFSIQEAARQLLLGATIYDESNAPHIRIKQKTNHGNKVKNNSSSKKETEYPSQKQKKVVTRTIARPVLDLRWLPGDLKTHVRSAASRSLWSSTENELDSNTVLIDEEDASITAAMESLDRRSSSDQPWWVVENDSDDDTLFLSKMNHTATSSATGTVRVSHVLGTMIATTRAPLITATAMLCILLPGIYSSARFDTILHSTNTTNPKKTDST